MKKIRKPAAAVLAAVMMLLLLCACGGSSAKDVPVSDIADKIDAALGKADSLSAVDANYIKGYMKLGEGDYAEYVVKINAYGQNIDEYGVFKAADSAQAKALKEALDSYLKLRLDSWMDEYMPEEKPKLTSAEVKTEGNYICYCILSDTDKTAAFGAFTDALK